MYPVYRGPDDRILSFRSLLRGIWLIKPVPPPRRGVAVHENSVIIPSTDHRHILILEWTGEQRDFHHADFN